MLTPMPSNDPMSHPALPSNPADASVQSPAPAAGPDPRLERPQRIVSVMCPAGFTAFSADGLTLDQPLFARVTYRRR